MISSIHITNLYPVFVVTESYLSYVLRSHEDWVQTKGNLLTDLRRCSDVSANVTQKVLLLT